MLRAGARALTSDANVVLFCDPDVVWRNPETLLDLASVIVAHDAALSTTTLSDYSTGQ